MSGRSGGGRPSRRDASRATMRATLVSNGAVTTHRRSHSACAAVPTMTAPSSTNSGALASCAACFAARMRRTISGWVRLSSAALPSGVAKARSASRRRSNVPSAFKMSAPNRWASFGSSGEPGSKISRLIWSASASGTPWAENTAVTVDFPQPLRPVMPSAIIA